MTLLIPQDSNYQIHRSQELVSLIEVQLKFFSRTDVFSSNTGVPLIVFLNTEAVT